VGWVGVFDFYRWVFLPSLAQRRRKDGEEGGIGGGDWDDDGGAVLVGVEAEKVW